MLKGSRKAPDIHDVYDLQVICQTIIVLYDDLPLREIHLLYELTKAHVNALYCEKMWMLRRWEA